MRHIIINNYHNAVRDLIAQGKTRGGLIMHQIGNDEVHDPTLVSQRVYGNRYDYDVVMIACGTSDVWQTLPQEIIALPTPSSLIALKRQQGVIGADWQAVQVL